VFRSCRRFARDRLAHLTVRLLSVNEEQNEGKWSNERGGFSIVVLRLAVQFGMAQRPQLGYEPEGREFESLRAHHIYSLHHHNLRVVLIFKNWGTTGDNYVKAHANSLRLRFAKGHLLTEFCVPIGHSLVTMSDPEAQQIFGSSLLPKMRDAKSPEGMESGFLALHAGEDGVKAASQHVRLCQRATVGRPEDESFLPAVNEVFRASPPPAKPGRLP
jgi:hypothetical protein